MRFEVDWQSTGPNAAPEERATIADLRVFVGDSNACDNLQPRRRGRKAGAAAGVSVRHEEHVTVSVYPLAEEIALGWWRLFGARDERLRLAEGRAGYALPDVQLAFDGSGFDAVSRPIAYQNPEVRFTCGNTERLSRAEAESALTDFVEQVRSRLEASRVRDTGLQRRWQRVQASRQDAQESAFCEATGALGLDPYNIRDKDAEFIANAGALFHGEPLAELLSGLRSSGNRPGPSGDDVLAWLRSAEARPEGSSCLPGIDDLRGRMAEIRQAAANKMPWWGGYRCARAARRQLNIGMGERLRVATLAARLDGRAFDVAGSVAGVRAVVEIRDDAMRVHLRRVNSRYRETSELFAFARAIGDAVANPAAERSAVNDLHDAARQATGRAFAAEFLAPVDEVLSMREDGKDQGEMAERFGVSKDVVERQLQNRERIQEACAA